MADGVDAQVVRAHRALLVTIGLILVGFLGTWIWYFVGRERGPITSTGVIILIVWVALILLAVVLDLVTESRATPTGLLRTAFYFLLTFLSLTFFFTEMYWSYGTSRNSNHPLSHLDALYFMVGTLTTAGTGNLNAISETARAIQLAQLVLDFVLIVVALSLFVLRISEYRYQKQMERP
jgi:hypothetical protein